MSDIAGELARVRGAYEQPTLTLLHQRQAPAIIAIFRTRMGHRRSGHRRRFSAGGPPSTAGGG